MSAKKRKGFAISPITLAISIQIVILHGGIFTAARASLNNNITGNISIDNEGTIYADGKFVRNITRWKVASPVTLLANTTCVVIEGRTTGKNRSDNVGAILASFSNGIITDKSWQCIRNASKSLLVWPKAKSYAHNNNRTNTTWLHYNSDKPVANIDGNATWIWTENKREENVTCRRSFAFLVSDVSEIDCNPQVDLLDNATEYVNKYKMIINQTCNTNDYKRCLTIVRYMAEKFDNYFTRAITSNSYPSAAEINLMLSSIEKIMVEFVKSKCVADWKEDSIDIRNTSIEIHDYFFNDSQNAASFLEIKTNGEVKMHLNFSEPTNVHVLQIKFKNISKFEVMNSTRKLDSDIQAIKLFANNVDIRNFSRNDAVIFRFKNKGERGRKECLYLDTNKLEWLGDGLLLKKDSESITECHSNHLTHFGVFISEKKINPTHVEALKFITYVGCALSLIGILIVVVLYCTFRKDLHALSSDRYLVNLNLLLALGMTQILFFIGIPAFHNKTSCKAVAVLLHYTTLASLAWMLVEGIVLYIKVIKVYGGESVRLHYFFIAAWGLPAIIVTVTASVNIEGYSSHHWCWLSFKDGFIWSLYGPVAAVLLANFIIFVLVVRTVIKAQSEQNKKNKAFTSFRAVVILFPILGLTWIFSIFALNFEHVIWQYLFAIFNATQGFLIFLTYGIGNSEIRGVFKRIFCRKNISPQSKTTITD